MRFCLWDYFNAKPSLHWSVIHYHMTLSDILGVVRKHLLSNEAFVFLD